MPVPKITMERVKDVIYLVSVLIAVVFYIRDKATSRAVQETQMESVIENQENILNKLKEIDVKNEKQAEINGKILMYIELDATGH